MASEMVSYAGLALREYSAVVGLAERVLEEVSRDAANRKQAYIAALRALAAIKNGVYVAMAHLLMRASAELGEPPESIILEAFDPREKSFGASMGTVSQMRSLALVVIPAMRKQGMSDREILEALLTNGALSKAFRVIPAINAASKPTVPQEIAADVTKQAIELMLDTEATVEEVGARAKALRRYAAGEKPQGWFTTFDLPNGNVVVFAVVPRGKERGAVNSLTKYAERRDASPNDVTRFLGKQFRKTGGV